MGARQLPPWQPRVETRLEAPQAGPHWRLPGGGVACRPGRHSTCGMMRGMTRWCVTERAQLPLSADARAHAARRVHHKGGGRGEGEGGRRLT